MIAKSEEENAQALSFKSIETVTTLTKNMKLNVNETSEEEGNRLKVIS